MEQPDRDRITRAEALLEQVVSRVAAIERELGGARPNGRSARSIRERLHAIENDKTTLALAKAIVDDARSEDEREDDRGWDRRSRRMEVVRFAIGVLTAIGPVVTVLMAVLLFLVGR